MADIKLGVSLYCYQDEFERHKMNLEDCIRAVADLGATGIEILPEEMIRDPHHMTEKFLDQWFGWMDKYGTEPVAADVFCDEKGLYQRMGRQATFEEAAALQKSNIDMAANLGCKYIRSQIRDLNLLRAVLPYAQEKNVIIGIELHAPLSLKEDWIDEWYNVGEQMNLSQYLGLIPDFGVFEKRSTPIIIRQIIRDGASDLFKDEAQELVDAEWNWPDLEKHFKNKGADQADMDLIWRIFNFKYNDPYLLRDLMPRVIGFHGKFWNMLEDLTEESVDYETPIKVICESDFRGYINSEYEGSRHIQDIEEVQAVEQVRRHHAMMRNYIEKYS